MDLKKFALESLDESSETKLNMKNACLDDIIRAVELVADTYRAGKKMLLCGNGGSAADCQHIATEFMIRLSHDIQRPALPAIALTTDSSNLTAGGNDIPLVAESKGIESASTALLLIKIYVMFHICFWEAESIDENLERLGYNFRILKVLKDLQKVFKSKIGMK